MENDEKEKKAHGCKLEEKLQDELMAHCKIVRIFWEQYQQRAGKNHRMLNVQRLLTVPVTPHRVGSRMKPRPPAESSWQGDSVGAAKAKATVARRAKRTVKDCISTV
jgi:hypothetical protein